MPKKKNDFDLIELGKFIYKEFTDDLKEELKKEPVKKKESVIIPEIVTNPDEIERIKKAKKI